MTKITETLNIGSIERVVAVADNCRFSRLANIATSNRGTTATVFRVQYYELLTHTHPCTAILPVLAVLASTGGTGSISRTRGAIFCGNYCCHLWHLCFGVLDSNVPLKRKI